MGLCTLSAEAIVMSTKALIWSSWLDIVPWQTRSEMEGCGVDKNNPEDYDWSGALEGSGLRKVYNFKLGFGFNGKDGTLD